MKEKIFIACGGIGSRMLTTNLPKCLLPIPIHNTVETETILHRTLRLIKADPPITLLTGYGRELVEKQFPDYESFPTLNVNNPGGILTAIKKVMETELLDSYTFLLGDVIWSKEALRHMIRTRHAAFTTFYHDYHKGLTETYAITISNTDISYIYSLLHDTLNSLPPEKRVNGNLLTRIEDCRLGHLDQHMRLAEHGHKLIYQCSAVEDVDTDEQYKNLSLCVSTGLFDKPAAGKEWLNLKNRSITTDE